MKIIIDKKKLKASTILIEISYLHNHVISEIIYADKPKTTCLFRPTLHVCKFYFLELSPLFHIGCISRASLKSGTKKST